MRRQFLLAVILAACQQNDQGTGPGPTVILADSLVLAQPDSLEQFLPLRTQAISRDGGLLLETGTAILHFDSRGKLLRVLGRQGTGPGEFVRISSIGLLDGDSLVAAVDARRGRIVVFGVKDGGLRREVVLAAPFFPDQQWVVKPDTVVLPGKLRKQPFTTWVTTTDSLWHWGTAPPIFDSSLAAYSQGGEPSIAPLDDGWLALFPADPALYVLSSSGTPLRRIRVPSRQRLGVPPDIVEQAASVAQRDSFRFVASLVLANRRLTDGRYLLVHLDADAELNRSARDPSSGGASVSYSNVKYWASLLSADLSQACVDGLVPLSIDNILSPFFRTDDLFFVARRVGHAGDLRSVLYSYHVSDTGCRWVPTTIIEEL